MKKFNDVTQNKKYAEMEHEVMEFWRKDHTFQKSVDAHSKNNAYVFYDGPPFITGVPHYGTLLSSIIKDVVPRFWTMKGKRVERRWGWDCHGLPAENLVEKKLGIKDKRDVVKVGLETYIQACHSAMVQGGDAWESTVERIGRWVDFKGAYKTMDRDYMESVWWAFKTLYDKKKIYEGEKVLLYCPRCATPISKAEVSMDNSYRDVTDPSVYVKFALEDEVNTYVLAWTTTPWTLSANVALAINAKLTYVKVLIGGEILIVAEDLASKILVDEKKAPLEYVIKEKIGGEELVGKKYKPLFEKNINDVLLQETDVSEKTDVVVLAVINQKKEFLLGFRMYTKDKFGASKDFWIAPGGKIEQGEKIKDAISRELKEECNIEDYTIRKYIANYPGYSDNHELHCFLVEVDNVNQIQNNEPEKFAEWKFFTIDQLPVEYFPNQEVDQKFFIDAMKWHNAHRIFAADFVTTEDGTGIVHIAPAFGEDDYALAKKENLPLVNTVDDNGLYKDGRWAGQHVWETNKEIAKTLLQEGVVFKIDYIQHEYPHCHRCDTKLMYRAHPSWFMDIDGQRSEMLAKNENINWFPAHIKNKRFRNTVETAPDWNLSRDRFWATPLPVWRGIKEDGTILEKVVGSYAELKELSGQELSDYHLPYVDAVTFEWEGVTMKRIDKVMDCWFESGSMPFAQFHYPFENKDEFEANFPGDFIVEYVGQVRAWFYYMHAISVGIFGEESFKNVIVTGTIAGNDGRKMSKSYGNYTAPEILLEKYSADALRYLFVSSPLLNGDDFALVDKDVADVQRKLGTLWNSYAFFVMYANVDEWCPSESGVVHKSDNVLDQWIMSQLHVLTMHVDEQMQRYDLPTAIKPVAKFIDDLSNWYIRRSRKRFWKSENDGDKENAYATLHHVLVELSKIMAPFTPFISEEIYKNLTQGESVHLCEFPKSESNMINDVLNHEMSLVRDVISEGLKLRARSQIKVRQPLGQLKVESSKWHISQDMCNIICEELNVKKVVVAIKIEGQEKNIGEINGVKIELDTTISQSLKAEGDARELIRHIQQLRKKAGYNIDDRVVVGIKGMVHVCEEFHDLISHEVLADTMVKEVLADYDIMEAYDIDGEKITISLKK